ncbi:MAG: hypothetical protein CTY19_07225 [Methylomonas sp.]|nr:MAG: hypothetical protein CTY19_07225 [Methylomonas sp.]
MSHTIGFQPFVSQELSQEGLRKTSLDPFLSRSNYFDGRLLKAADLTRDQQYLDQRLLQTGRVLGAGVVRGLYAELTANQQIVISPGLAITGSGRVLESVNRLSIDLTDRATIAVLNQPPLNYFNRGLYAVVLHYTEKGVGIAETYPEDIGTKIETRINAYEEGVQLVLVHLNEAYPAGSELTARAALAGRFLPQLQALTEIPEDGVALGLLAIDQNIGQWLDRGLLYRPVGIQQHADGFQQLLAAHYEALLSDVLNARNWSSLNGAISASQYFQWLPPVGSLPKQAVNPQTGVQSFFPENFNVSMVPVRQEDIPVLEQEAMSQEVIDLRQDQALDIVILAPLSDEDFNFYARRLEAPTAQVNDDVFSLSARLLPALMPLSLSRRPIRRIAIDTQSPNYWKQVWDRVGEGQLRYLRRPARVAENHVSTVVLARGFKLPDALPASETQLQALNQQLLQAEQARISLQARLQTANQQITAAERQYARLQNEYEALKNAADNSLAVQIEARGIRDKVTLEAVRGYLDKTQNEPKIQDLTARVLALLDNTFDRVFWPSVMQSLDNAVLDKLLRSFLMALQADESITQLIEQNGRDWGLTDDILQQWQRTAEFFKG